MYRITRDIIRFTNGELHRRTIFKDNDKYFVKWNDGMVEVIKNDHGVWNEKKSLA